MPREHRNQHRRGRHRRPWGCVCLLALRMLGPDAGLCAQATGETAAMVAGEWAPAALLSPNLQFSPDQLYRISSSDPAVASVDRDGRVFAWKPGRTALRIERRIDGVRSVDQIELAVREPPTDQLRIDLRYEGWKPRADERAALERAVSRYRTILRSADARAFVPVPAGECGSRTGFEATVEGLLVVVAMHDGPAQTLAWGSPCVVNAAGRSRIAVIRINPLFLADLRWDLSTTALRRLEDVAVHEIGHGLGLVSLALDSVAGYDDGRGRQVEAGSAQWTGPAAVTVWHQLGGVGGVPIDASGGHWGSTVRVGDIMQGDVRGDEVLSALSLAALADRGYRVRMERAEPLPGSSDGRHAR